jgi:hypothetical protein
MSIATPPGTDDGPAETWPPNGVVSCSHGSIVPTAATAHPANSNHAVRVIGGRVAAEVVTGAATGVATGAATVGAVVAAGAPSLSESFRSIHSVPFQIRSPIHCVPVQKRIV